LYMPGRRRPASSPSRTLMLVESYTPPPLGVWFTSFAIISLGSNPHGHHHVAVLVHDALTRRAHFAGAFLILQLEGHLVLGDGAEKVEKVLCVEPDLDLR